MQTLSVTLSPWQQLKRGELGCQEALSILVDRQGIVNLDLLDPEVSDRFFQQISNCYDLPPVIPLLLWRSCYHLGSPITLIEENIQKLNYTFTNIKIILIAEESYYAWYLTQTFNLNGIRDDDSVVPLFDPN